MNGPTKRERLRRVVLLCCHFARNLAYYRTGHDRLSGGSYSQILATIDGNFLDMGVIEWCKLLGDKKGRHFWGNVVSDHQAFEADLLKHLGQTSDQFASYVEEMREYRDKFLAHLDDGHVMNIPNLDRAKAAVEFYHGHVVRNEASANDLAGLPTELVDYNQQCVDEALAMLNRCKL
jgi:hypothetical protein